MNGMGSSSCCRAPGARPRRRERGPRTVAACRKHPTVPESAGCRGLRRRARPDPQGRRSPARMPCDHPFRPPVVSDRNLRNPASSDERGTPADRFGEQATAVPLSAPGTAEHTPAAPSAAEGIDQLGNRYGLELHLLADPEQFPRDGTPLLPVCGGYRKLALELLEFLVQIDTDLPERLIAPEGVSRAERGGSAGPRSVHENHSPIGPPYPHGGEEQADLSFVDEQARPPDPVHRRERPGEGAELPAGLSTVTSKSPWSFLAAMAPPAPEPTTTTRGFLFIVSLLPPAEGAPYRRPPLR